MGAFRVTRNVELSTIYYIEQSFATDWTGVTVVKTFRQVYDTGVDVPIVCIRLFDTSSTRLEVGATTLENRFGIIIDIFAASDGQRLDLADYVLEKLRTNWDYYTFAHESGNNEVLVKTLAGRIHITDFITNSKIDLGDTVDTKDRFRHTLSVIVRKEVT